MNINDEAVQAALCEWFGDKSGLGIIRGEPEVEAWFERMRAALSSPVVRP